ncbi:GNAT family N-acetyltransferase [Peribacillus sp. TH27]|uniref:GNAT family N-acetyltransferase n=1 Tax=Peribacillus sp. TH27 TaxID=2798484 RepID=UPI0019132572|nr:GNAT family N-acetyltransferase [Peribacillus sp. TH27]MBK5458030.1 GNAT family N-acetyltransferase [Peribacillus sp. TH27]
MQSNLGLEGVPLEHQHIDKIHQFKCSDEDKVDSFLKEESINLMDRNFVRTRLFFDNEKNLVGFYSLFNDTIKMNKQKRLELQVKLPDQVKVIPAIRLHYIAVDEKYRKKRYGEDLLGCVFIECAEIAKRSGCTLIVLESTSKTRGFYEKYDFTHIRKENEYSLMAYNTEKLIDLLE